MSLRAHKGRAWSVLPVALVLMALVAGCANTRPRPQAQVGNAPAVMPDLPVSPAPVVAMTQPEERIVGLAEEEESHGTRR